MLSFNVVCHNTSSVTFGPSDAHGESETTVVDELDADVPSIEVDLDDSDFDHTDPFLPTDGPDWEQSEPGDPVSEPLEDAIHDLEPELSDPPLEDAALDSIVDDSFFDSISISENSNSTLSAIVTVETSEICRVDVVFFSSDTDSHLSRRSELGTSHIVTLVTMKEETIYTLIVMAHRAGEEVITSDERYFVTGQVPSSVPTFTIGPNLPDSRFQPGITVFSPIASAPGSENSVLMGVDQQGDVVWYYLSSSGVPGIVNRNIQMLPDGNIFFSMGSVVQVITPGGETVQEVTSSDVGVETFHHDAIMLPNGRFMTFAFEEQTMLVEELDPDH